MYDFLIFGHGLAGALLGDQLIRAGASCFFIDDQHPNAASGVAAGLINPITGRRFVKSWRIDQLLPAAQACYHRLEAELGTPLYHEQPILRALFSIEEENDWLARCLDPNYRPYIADQHALSIPDGLIHPHGFGLVNSGARVDIGLLVQRLRERRLGAGLLFPERGHIQQLKVSRTGVSYGHIRARAVIFAEGRWGKENPFFPELPLGGDKGEVLQVRFPDDFQLPCIIKHRVFLVPLSDGICWIGSNYSSRYDDDQPTASGRSWLEENLHRSVRVPYEVMAHKSAIRPTVKDRRPLMGQHPDYDNVFIFNGMGTKGTSLAPYWSEHFAGVLCQGNALDPEVDLRRFQSR